MTRPYEPDASERTVTLSQRDRNSLAHVILCAAESAQGEVEPLQNPASGAASDHYRQVTQSDDPQEET